MKKRKINNDVEIIYERSGKSLFIQITVFFIIVLFANLLVNYLEEKNILLVEEMILDFTIVVLITLFYNLFSANKIEITKDTIRLIFPLFKREFEIKNIILTEKQVTLRTLEKHYVLKIKEKSNIIYAKINSIEWENYQEIKDHLNKLLEET